MLLFVYVTDYVSLYIQKRGTRQRRKLFIGDRYMTSTIGQRIRAARMAAGLTQEEFADLVEVSRASAAKWEAAGDGKVNLPATKRLPAIASALGVTLEHLLDDSIEIAPEAKIDGRRRRAAAYKQRWTQRDLKILQRMQDQAVALAAPRQESPVTDRQRMNFWAAVEYDVLEKLPGISGLFGLRAQHPRADYVRSAGIALQNDSIDFASLATQEDFMIRLGRAALERALFKIQNLYLLDHVPAGTLTDDTLTYRRALAVAANIEYFYVATRSEAVDVILQLLQPFVRTATTPLTGTA